MLTLIDARQPSSRALVERIIARLPLQDETDALDTPSIESAVSEIIRAVKRDGDAALFDYTARFDGFRPTPESVAIPVERWAQALAELSPELGAALRIAYQRIWAFHEKQRPTDWDLELGPGSRVGQRHRPLESVGIYVPGGKAFYPSSLLMNAIPARIAGVRRIVAVTPVPLERIPKSILAAAHLCGIDAIYSVGGAQA
ncbi:MAG: histidinol dehydrogenase, partial [Myxococcales bacterium]|nr:histidinol dehydrogenase [Myxococcales bacterium]